MGTGYLVTSVAALDFRPARRATCRAQPPKVREDAAVDSEIAAGRIALFTPHLRVALVSVALAPSRFWICDFGLWITGQGQIHNRQSKIQNREGDANVDCQGPRPAFPPLSRGTPLCAARTFLYPFRGSGRSALPGLAQSRCRVCPGHLHGCQEFVKCRLFRGRDSNPNLLIQSQLSYH